jgi:hypothetical protein
MAFALTPGQEMRLDGAPDQMLPPAQDKMLAIAYRLLEEDEEGMLYGGDVRNAIPVANQMLMEADRERLDAAMDSGAATAGRRSAQRQAAMGVAPESLPPGPYGVASGRDVREANRPLPEAEAALTMEQDAADRIVRGLRDGNRNWEAEGEYQFLQDRGEQNPLAAQGQRDVDVRRSIMERRGQMYEMPDGTIIPVGRDPTAADLRGEREWQQWVNESPGSERQARYNPAGYEEAREDARNDIRDRARRDMAKYGTGPDSAISLRQQSNRQARAASEDRVAAGQREVDIARLARKAGISRAEARKQMDAARAEILGDEDRPLTSQERLLESQALRDTAGDRRDADLAARRANRIDQAMLAGGQPTGGPLGTRATTTAINQLGPGWREIALLDRLTNGRVGGPTPLGVQQYQAEAIAQGVGRSLMGVLANMDPNHAAMAGRLKEQERRDAIYADADKFVEQQFAWRGNTTGASSFNIDEQQKTIQYLMGKYQLPLAEAQSIVDSIAAGRRPPPARPPAPPAAPMPDPLPPAGGAGRPLM